MNLSKLHDLKEVIVIAEKVLYSFGRINEAVKDLETYLSFFHLGLQSTFVHTMN